jgi:large subunit ribosomal protein L35
MGMPSRIESAGDNPPHRPVRLRGIEMPKLKTKSAAKKRFRLTGTGKVRANVACKQHNLRKRSKKMRRQARGTMILVLSDARIAKSCMPYL